MRSMIVVKLNTVEKVKRFVNIVSKFNHPIEAWEIDGHKVYCASSIISVFNLDFNKDIGVKINTTDEQTAKEFYSELEQLV